MIHSVRRLLVLFGVMTALTGIVYPFIITAVAQLVFPYTANGSLLHSGKTIVGSRLIGQSFSSPQYFWGRLSATTPQPYNGAASSPSNLATTNPTAIDTAGVRLQQLRAADRAAGESVPVDLVTASASGLDPDISPASAAYQVHRVALVRRIPEDKVQDLVVAHTSSRTFGVLGEPRVNVLELNLALDSLYRYSSATIND